MTATHVRVATYIRISTDEKNQPNSLSAQTHRLDAFANSQEHWKIGHRYSDEASGAKLERKGLQQALEDAARGKFDVLLVYRLDRLTRSVQGFSAIIAKLNAAGVAFRSATEPFETSTAAGLMMVQMLSVFAEFERATIRDRIMAGLERKAARGEWAGTAPFGYVKGVGHILIPVPEEALVVAEIFERYTVKLDGSASVARWLSSRGIRTRSGKHFSPQTILGILRNRTYLGEVPHSGTSHPGVHEPLVGEPQFAAAQELLLQRGQNAHLRRSNQSVYLLSGLVRCEHCGKAFVGTAAKSSLYRYYTCSSVVKFGDAVCEADRLPAPELEGAVLDQLMEVLGNEPLIRDAINAAFAQVDADRPRRTAELARCDAQLQKLARKLERWFKAFEAETISAEACAPHITELTSERDALQQTRLELTADTEVDVPRLSEEDLTALRLHVREVIETGAPPQRKALMSALIEEIKVLSRDEIYPYFRVPRFELRQ